MSHEIEGQSCVNEYVKWEILSYFKPSFYESYWLSEDTKENKLKLMLAGTANKNGNNGKLQALAICLKHCLASSNEIVREKLRNNFRDLQQNGIIPWIRAKDLQQRNESNAMTRHIKILT